MSQLIQVGNLVKNTNVQDPAQLKNLFRGILTLANIVANKLNGIDICMAKNGGNHTDMVNYLNKTIDSKDLHKEQVYKPSFYPKYFYTDNNDQLHAYGFYSSSDYKEQPIAMDFYRPILNPDRKALVSELETDGSLDMGILVKHAFNNYIKWPGDPLPEIYNKVFVQPLNDSAKS